MPSAELTSSGAPTAAGGSSSQLKWAGLGTAAVTCAAAAFTLARAEPAGVVVLPEPAHPVSQHLEDTVDWVHELAGQPDVQQVLTAQTMQHHSVLKHDHLVRCLPSACCSAHPASTQAANVCSSRPCCATRS